MSTVVVQCNYPNGMILQLKNGQQIMVKGHINATIVENGFGLTDGVDSEFWDQWLAENKDFPVVKNGCILANSNVKTAVKEAQSNKGVKSGNEQTQKPVESMV